MTHLFAPISSYDDPQFQVDLQLRSPNSQFSPQKAQKYAKIIRLKTAQIAGWHLKVAQNYLKLSPNEL